MQVLARVFITPMPVLRLLERLGVSRELKLLQEAVATMRGSLLGVIHVRARRINAWGCGSFRGALSIADPRAVHGGPVQPSHGCCERLLLEKTRTCAGEAHNMKSQIAAA